jgi:heme/copper-type cytochrome/quinol oxidase subunit 2
MLATSCKKDEDDPPPVEENKNFATLKTYLTSNIIALLFIPKLSIGQGCSESTK